MSYLIVLALACTIAYLGSLSRKARRARLPPGPPSIPIVGALFSLPTVRPWITFNEWSQKYGSDILFLDLPNQPTILLNSNKVAQELMERRSRNYSDRAVKIIDKLTGWDFALSLMPYGQRWRETRRVFHQYFHHAVVKDQYYGTIGREIHEMLLRAAQSPDDGPLNLDVIRRSFATTIMDIVYGIKPGNEQHELITLSQKGVDIINESRTNVFWVEYFPWLAYLPSWLPGPHASAVEFGRKHARTVAGVRRAGFDIAAKRFAAGTATPSVTQRLLQRLEPLAGTDEYESEEEIAIDVTGVAYSGAL
ncbi:hypothetical protein EIP86_000432 [Pleurotus ostreatoroseus]|nr:hypothetical protein EIP86_000432 [Pleurotus ostreatoroseus]